MRLMRTVYPSQLGSPSWLGNDRLIHGPYSHIVNLALKIKPLLHLDYRALSLGNKCQKALTIDHYCQRLIYLLLELIIVVHESHHWQQNHTELDEQKFYILENQQ